MYMNIVTKLQKKFNHDRAKRLISNNERQFKECVKYLFLPKKSDALLIVFSGFTGEVRRYNYVSSFCKMEINQLYILDTWGYQGSYYWMDNGDIYPEKMVNELIDTVIKNHAIKRIITCGSSKGGSAAIYFGLINNANYIFSGACQFLVGTYLGREEHIRILEGMIGDLDKETMIAKLDTKIAEIIRQHKNSNAINLLYSTEELTYERQIIPLKACLDDYGVTYNEKIEQFKDHSEVGNVFPIYVCNELKKLL
jgi:hypothetical protein